jgi:hypothetical protein
MLVGMRRERLRSDPENRLAEGRVAQNVLWIDSKFLARVGYISICWSLSVTGYLFGGGKSWHVAWP